MSAGRQIRTAFSRLRGTDRDPVVFACFAGRHKRICLLKISAGSRGFSRSRGCIRAVFRLALSVDDLHSAFSALSGIQDHLPRYGKETPQPKRLPLCRPVVLPPKSPPSAAAPRKRKHSARHRPAKPPRFVPVSPDRLLSGEFCDGKPFIQRIAEIPDPGLQETVRAGILRYVFGGRRLFCGKSVRCMR